MHILCIDNMQLVQLLVLHALAFETCMLNVSVQTWLLTISGVMYFNSWYLPSTVGSAGALENKLTLKWSLIYCYDRFYMCECVIYMKLLLNAITTLVKSPIT